MTNKAKQYLLDMTCALCDYRHICDFGDMEIEIKEKHTNNFLEFEVLCGNQNTDYRNYRTIRIMGSGIQHV